MHKKMLLGKRSWKHVEQHKSAADTLVLPRFNNHDNFIV